jgi:hypothetical protein
LDSLPDLINGFIPQQEGRIGAEAIFLSYVDSQKKMKDPEIYPREDGTVYVCGESDNVPLPDDPADVTFDEVIFDINLRLSLVIHTF